MKMTSRRPLSVKNSADPRGGQVMKKKRGKFMFLVLDRPAIVSQLNVLLNSTSSQKISEEELLRPTVFFFIVLPVLLFNSVATFSQRAFRCCILEYSIIPLTSLLKI